MNRQTSANATTAQRQSPPRLTSILGSFLEVITHEIIYTRSLYPRDAFSPTRHFGIACHACRHPDVVDYIFETLQVAVAGIVSGLVDGLYLIFYDSETDELLERFAFEFQLDDTVHIVNASGEGAAGASSASDGSAFAQGGANAYAKGSRSNSSNSARVGVDERQELERKIQELERSLRDVLLKIVSLDGTDMGRKRGQANFSPSVTFKLCLHTVGDPSQSSSPSSPSSKNSTRPKCPELEEATSQGKWFRADSESCSFRRPTVETGTPEEENALMTSATPSDQSSSRRGECVTRPLKSINVPSCGLNLQLMVEFLPTSY